MAKTPAAFWREHVHSQQGREQLSDASMAANSHFQGQPSHLRETLATLPVFLAFLG